MLSPDHRAVIVLRHLAGLSIDEPADVLAIPRGTVASRLHHATRALRAAIEAADRHSASDATVDRRARPGWRCTTWRPIVYTSGVLLPDGRVALMDDIGDLPGPRRIDVLTIDP